MVRVLAAAIGLTALLAAGAAAQDPPAADLTVSAAARQALEMYPSVAAASAQALAARRSAEGAAASRWPKLGLSASATRYQDPMLVAPLHRFDPQSPPDFDETLLQARIDGSYMLFDGGARGARVATARHRADAARNAVSGVAQEVLLAVTRQFALLEASAEALAAHDVRLQALTEEVQRSRRLLETGRAARLEVLRAEAALAAARTDRVHTLTQLDTGARELARLLGAAEPVNPARLVPLRAPERLEPVREELVARALDSNPNVVKAARERLAAEAEVKLARSAFLPVVQLFGAYDERGAADAGSSGEWNFGGGVSLPLFDGGARRREQQRAEAQREAARRQLDLARLDVAARIDRSLAALHEAESRVQQLQHLVVQYDEVARGERLALVAGAGTQTDYLAALADLLGARGQLASASMNRITALAELAAATGELTLAWLEQNLEKGQ